MIRLALAMLSLRSLRGGKVKIVHVRGHSGDPGNEGADYLARIGATRAAVDDYDWEMMRDVVEKEIQDLGSGRMTGTHEEFQVLLNVCYLHPTAL
jgi:ribonuclease HI